jgi:hypothetical protein
VRRRKFLTGDGLEVEHVEGFARRRNKRWLLSLLLNQLEGAAAVSARALEHSRELGGVDSAKCEERAAGEIAEEPSTG